MKKIYTTIIMLFIAYGLLAQTATPPALGDGTSGNPYQIETLENLYWIAENSTRWNKHYLQTASIDASSTNTWFGGQGWTPIGSPTLVHFTGVYNGNGYIISGLYMNRPTTDFVGLFGGCAEAKLYNIGLEDLNFTGDDYVGGLSGTCDGTTVYNCYTTGSVTGNSEVGGLIGSNHGNWENQNYLLRRCFSNANVSSTSNSAGGLLGSNWDTKLSDCYSRGNVSGHYSVGGLIGFHEYSTVKNCYSTGSVLFTNTGGGLIGDTWIGNVIRSYWNTQTSGQSSSAGGEGRPTASMTFPTGNLTYVYWNYNIWRNDINYEVNDGYPFLKMLSPPGNLTTGGSKSSSFTLSWDEPVPRHALTLIGYNIYRAGIQLNTTLISAREFTDNNPLAGMITYEVTAVYFPQGESGPSDPLYVSNAPIPSIGDGSPGNPYQIASLGDLYWLVHSTRFENNNLTGIHFLQTQDINLSASAGWNDGKGWIPIGEFNGTPFSGIYNGNGKVISGLFIDRTDFTEGSGIGLFGYTNQADIHNLGLSSVNVSGASYVGGLVGECKHTTIDDCFVTGILTGSTHVGGLVGRNIFYSEIYRSYSSGSVVSTTEWDGYAGGLAGVNGDYSKLSNCYTTSDVTTELASYIGGLVGYHYSSSNIIKCYSIGSVSGSNYTGGLIGNAWFANVTDSYWNTQTSGQASSAGGAGAMGRTTSEMTFPYAVNTYTGWDLLTTWGADDTYYMNNGYPYLVWQVPEVPEIRVLDNVVLPLNFTGCFDAEQSILVSNMTFQDGSNVELTAGQNIKLLPNTHIENGALFHARIDLTGNYCNLADPSFAPENDQPTEGQAFSDSGEYPAYFTVYPNPTTGIFTVEFIHSDNTGPKLVEVSTIMGELVFQKAITGTRLRLDIGDKPSGIYIIHVGQGSMLEVKKLVKH